MTQVGDIFELLETSATLSCEIVEESERHYYLTSDSDIQWFDIVLPKYLDDDCEDKSKFLNLSLTVGDFVTVKVYTINIADDGTPGAFVTFVKKEEDV